MATEPQIPAVRAGSAPHRLRRRLTGGYTARCERRGHWWDVKIYDAQRRRITHSLVGCPPTRDDLELHVRISQDQERHAVQRQEGG
jgi:hypothetical protein